ncbi:hypothetical protein Tco_0585202 [Tanacetum coccineum]
MNAVFSSSSFAILIWWYPLYASKKHFEGNTTEGLHFQSLISGMDNDFGARVVKIFEVYDNIRIAVFRDVSWNAVISAVPSRLKISKFCIEQGFSEWMLYLFSLPDLVYCWRWMLGPDIISTFQGSDSTTL